VESSSRTCRLADLQILAEAQITLINLEQANIEEVFLPYLIVGRNHESLYEVMKEKQFLLSDGST
jgi:uncharacterized protein YciU (UPF0263 family)